MVKHSGLDESGESTESEEEGEPLLVGSNGHLDISRLPKGGWFSGSYTGWKSFNCGLP